MLIIVSQNSFLTFPPVSYLSTISNMDSYVRLQLNTAGYLLLLDLLVNSRASKIHVASYIFQ